MTRAAARWTLTRGQRDTFLFGAGIVSFFTLLFIPPLRDPLIIGLTATALGVPLVMRADEIRETEPKVEP